MNPIQFLAEQPVRPDTGPPRRITTAWR